MRRSLMVAIAALCACGDNAEGVECNEPGQTCTWAGVGGVDGFNGDGLHRTKTELYWTMDLSFASDGTVWFIDWNNHLVRRVLADDTVKTYIGWTDPLFPGDGVPG